jgi:hypothetical protein
MVRTCGLLGSPLASQHRCLATRSHAFEDMPNVATGSLSIAVGDMRAAYQIVDRVGIRTLRDPYSCEALRRVLHHQACRRRCDQLRGHQADRVLGQLINWGSGNEAAPSSNTLREGVLECVIC